MANIKVTSHKGCMALMRAQILLDSDYQCPGWDLGNNLIVTMCIFPPEGNWDKSETWVGVTRQWKRTSESKSVNHGGNDARFGHYSFRKNEIHRPSSSCLANRQGTRSSRWKETLCVSGDNLFTTELKSLYPRWHSMVVGKSQVIELGVMSGNI